MATSSVTIWAVTPGRMGDFIALAKQAKVIQQRLGGAPRLATTTFGGQAAGQLVFVVEHQSLGDLAAYTERLAADEEWQRLWASNMANNPNPVGRIVSHSIISDVSGF